MKKLPLLMAALLIALLLSSCLTTSDTSLTVIPSSNDKDVQGTSSIAAMSDGDLQMVVASNHYDGRDADFLVSFATSRDSLFTFREDDIVLYGGNYQKNDWTLIDVWDSTYYLKAAQRRSNAAFLMAGFIGTIAILDMILNDDSDFTFDFGYSYYPSPYYRGRYGYTFRTDDPGVLASFIALNAIESALVKSQLSDMEVAGMSDTLLLGGTVDSSHKLSGLVRFRNVPKYPDYKLSYRSVAQDKEMEFVFSRSDRAEIVDPWKEKTHPIYALNYNYTVMTKRNSLTFSFLSPKNVGFFTGVSFFPPIKFEPQSGMVGLIGGLTWKILPFFWLHAGAEVQWQPAGRGHDALGLLGIEYCVYHYSLYGGAVYSKDERAWYGEVGLGIAFF